MLGLLIKFSFFVRSMLFLVAVVFVSSCTEGANVADGGTRDTTPPVDERPPPITVDPPVGVVDDSGFYVRVFEGDQIEYRMQKGTAISGTEECKITNSSTVKNISCVVDLPEEDLWFHGLKFQYNFPADMCSYAHFMPYYYESFMIGQVSSAIVDRRIAPTINIYKVGGVHGFGGTTISIIDVDDLNGNGDTEDLIDVAYPNTATAPPDGIQSQIGMDGSPLCAFDYSLSEGPRCCSGQSLVRYFERSTVDFEQWDQTTVRVIDWGMPDKACIGGPATETQTISKNNIPIGDVSYVEKTGLNKVYDPPKPIDAMEGRYINLPLANYADDFPAPPHALDGYRSFQPYRWECRNRASEIVARIDVYVREWNDYTEFVEKGNPDTGGFESDPFTEVGINDFVDWKDVFTVRSFPYKLD